VRQLFGTNLGVLQEVNPKNGPLQNETFELLNIESWTHNVGRWRCLWDNCL